MTPEQHPAPEPRGRVEQPAGPAPREAPRPDHDHPPGTHPEGATAPQHPVRVLPPRVFNREHPVWQHWHHPEFRRPAFYWDWGILRAVTCAAEDSYGNQYPVTETVGPGFGFDDMTPVEDAALDRCYSESGGDEACFLATCTHD